MEHDDSGQQSRSTGRGHRPNNQRSRNRPPQHRPRSSKEWKLIEKLLDKSLNEQAKARRWGVVFKSLTFLYLFVVLIAFWDMGNQAGVKVSSDDHVALIELNGMIAENEPANANAVATSLRAAFEQESAKAILLKINSPGGSPVQSGMIYDEIRRLREKNPDKKLIAVITDIGASGAYYVAAAADEIYADKASLVGSIGVISMGFGFTELIGKLGVERRVYTSGENKALLDPFLPLKDKEVAHFSEVLDFVHRQFIDQVKLGRGERLLKDDVFNGLLWSGEQAVQIGLVDGLASPGQVARDKIGEENIVNYTRKPNPLEQIAGRLGSSFSNAIVQTLTNAVIR